MARIPPGVRVATLFVFTVAMFVVPPLWVGIATVLLVVVLLVAGMPPTRLLRQARRPAGLLVVIVLSYAITSIGPARDHWIHVWRVPINLGGAALGAELAVRILVVVLASELARLGDPRAIAAGLRQLGAPKSIALTVDAVITLFGDGGRGRGGGRGGGRGRGGGGGGGHGGNGGGDRDGEVAPKPGSGGFIAALQRLRHGDVGFLTERLVRDIDRAEAHLSEQDLEPALRARLRDLAVITGVALTMLGIKVVKILPSLPFAPGHKMLVYTPLYVVATLLTRSRWGATSAGFVLGLVAFLLGDGRYGVFEIAKHVAPGIASDLLVPVFAGGDRRPGRLVWTFLGAVIALARFATILIIVVLVQAPAVAWAVLAPGLALHTTFGALSGYVTWHIVGGLDAVRARFQEEDPA